LNQIQTVAQKLKELREKRDIEKAKFDEEVKILAEVRKEINEQKSEMQRMYVQAGISVPKMSN